MTISTYIRDAAYDRLAKVGSWKSMRKTPIPTLEPDALPALGIYVIRENMTADGDANVGPPRYIADTVISFMVVDLAGKPDVLAGAIDKAIDLIQDTLLTDGSFVSLVDKDGHAIIDSIPTIARTYSFPNQGETYFCEVRLQMTFRYFCNFQPLAPNLLRTVSVDVRPDGDTVPVAQNYDIELTG